METRRKAGLALMGVLMAGCAAASLGVFDRAPDGAAGDPPSISKPSDGARGRPVETVVLPDEQLPDVPDAENGEDDDGAASERRPAGPDGPDIPHRTRGYEPLSKERWTAQRRQSGEPDLPFEDLAGDHSHRDHASLTYDEWISRGEPETTSADTGVDYGVSRGPDAAIAAAKAEEKRRIEAWRRDYWKRGLAEMPDPEATREALGDGDGSDVPDLWD